MEIFVHSVCSRHSKLLCCGRSSAAALRSPRDPHHPALAPSSSSGIPGSDHEVIHPGLFQGDCDENHPSGVPQHVKEGSDRWPRNYLLEKQSFLLLWKEDVRRCAQSPHSRPHLGGSLVYHCPSSAVPITENRRLGKNRDQAASELSEP